MKETSSGMAKILMVSAALLLAACQYYPTYSPGRGHGPPPHAPAHGYRAKQQGHELVYDSGLGVYVVVDLPNVYYYDGIYYRYDHDHWYYSTSPGRGWDAYDTDRKLPPGLAKKHGKGKKKGNPHY